MKFTINHGLAGLVLLLASATAAAQQEETPAPPDISGPDKSVEYPAVYRVEAIVFRHAGGRSDRLRANEPVDYTGHLDPLLVATVNGLTEQHLAELARFGPPVAISGEIDETTPFLQTEDETIRPIPPVYSALGELSGPARRAMTRLTSAPQYEPLIARAWMQLAPPGQRTATVRVHDQTVVDVIAPPETDSSPLLAEVLPFPPPNEGPARPLEVFRLDGTVRLRRRQFLHLDLDLVWQEPARALVDSVAANGFDADEGRSTNGFGRPVDDTPEAAVDGWHLHRLQQSRIVQPGRLEYFDSSLFGVLVRIERFEQVVPEIEEPQPEPEAPGQDANDVASAVTDSGG